MFSYLSISEALLQLVLKKAKRFSLPSGLFISQSYQRLKDILPSNLSLNTLETEEPTF